MMGLSRSKPLRSSGEHDWEPETHADTGGTRYVCSRCGDSTWRAYGDEPEPDEWPCSGLNRGSGLDPVSESNSGRSHQKDEAFREYVRGLPCLVCSQRPSDPHHVLTWGSGRGDWVEGRGNLAPLCREHHGQVDAPGWGPTTFEARHGIDLEQEAIRIGRQYREQANHGDGG